MRCQLVLPHNQGHDFHDQLIQCEKKVVYHLSFGLVFAYEYSEQRAKHNEAFFWLGKT